MSGAPSTSADSSRGQAAARDAVLVKSSAMPEGSERCRGHTFSEYERTGRVDYSALFESLATTGFQATHFARAVDIVRAMRKWRLSDEPVADDEDDELRSPEARAQVKCKVFLGYTSNMISCGVRETLLFLAKNRLVDVIVTTAGGIEEDLIKCLAPHYIGDFRLNGAELRKRGVNRIGNLLVPNESYCKFEDWFKPLVHKLHDEQEATGHLMTPSELIRRLGTEINDESSVYYWCAKHGIRVYCPAITDGSLGDMLFFHTVGRPGFVLDVVRDIKNINQEAVFAKRTGMVVLGGGVVKHHVFNANLMRNGADYTVLINTASEYDGSDAGADPDEAISWGKVRVGSRTVKLHADASLVFPLLVARAFCDEQQ
jgi:deoxyhypusine synthase